MDVKACDSYCTILFYSIPNTKMSLAYRRWLIHLIGWLDTYCCFFLPWVYSWYLLPQAWMITSMHSSLTRTSITFLSMTPWLLSAWYLLSWTWEIWEDRVNGYSITLTPRTLLLHRCFNIHAQNWCESMLPKKN